MRNQTTPKADALFAIYLEMGFDTFCEFDGISDEGRRLAFREWERRDALDRQDAREIRAERRSAFTLDR